MSHSGEGRSDIEANRSSETPNSTYSSKRMKMAQAQVSEVIDVMKNNVNKVLERENHLASLDQRADNLQAGASQFQQSSRSLRQKYWWQNVRMMIIIGVIVGVLLLLIILWASN
ncbi:unnamed protein product [Caenorhabditis bovis]|uniref:V-SNARE coiled-coil homology domain-containing protein n=1 Tax=Caenorhabditis bovis TaxID=2654633 RepID=A0A8S1E6H3_9PELO|nr:unnamed protein product [Caenorhabditis bovis]